jgi:hypothetical protein
MIFPINGCGGRPQRLIVHNPSPDRAANAGR